MMITKFQFGLVLVLLVSGYFIGRYALPFEAPSRGEEAVEALVSILNGHSVRQRSDASQASHLLTRPITHESSLTIRSVISKMDANELERLWDSKHRHFDFTSADDTALAAAILTRLARLEPETALAKVSDVGAAKYDILPAIFKGWATDDPQGALDQVRAETDPRTRHPCMVAIIEQVGVNDPDKAVDLFMEALDDKIMPARAWNSMESFFRRWAKLDPEGAANKALYLREHGTSPEPATLMGGFRGALQAWAYTDPQAAIRWIDGLPPSSTQKEAYATLIGSWAESSPKEAADFAISHDVASKFAWPLRQVIGQWVRADFAEAAAWVDAVDDPAMRQRLQKDLLDLSQAHVTADRDQALTYAAQHLDNAKVVDSLKNHLTTMVRDGETDEALNWTKENVADPEQRAAIEKDLVDSVIWWRPNDFPKYADLLPQESETRQDAYEATAFQWSKRDPVAAKAWMEALPKDLRSVDLMLGFARGWLEANRQAASDWIASNSELRSSNAEGRTTSMSDDLASLRSMAAMREHAIEESLTIAQEIEHPYLRDLTFEAILKEWPRNQTTAPSIRARIEALDYVSDDVKWRVFNRRYGHPN